MKLDDKAFEAAVRKRVADNPDKVYEIPEVWNEERGEMVEGTACVYVDRDDDGGLVGSCLMGCALVDLGVPPEKLLADDSMGLSDLNEFLELGLSAPYVEWGDKVQEWQDDGAKWWRAVNLADRVHPLPE